MNRTGIIVDDMGKFSKVKLLRHTACGNCGACQLGDDQKDILLIAKNDVKAHVGDMVEVEMGTDGVLSAAFIMYIIPLMALFVGIFMGRPIFQFMGLVNIEIASAVLGLLLMAATFLIIKSKDQKFLNSDKYTAHIHLIVQKNHSDIVPL